MKKNKKKKGLSDRELVKKYEGGGIDFKKLLKPIFKKKKQTA